MKRTKQILAFLLSVSLAVTPVPFTVTAEDTAPAGESMTAGTLEELPDHAWEGISPTDAPIEMTVGSTLPLYDISAQDYLDGKILIKVAGLDAEIITEEGCSYVKLAGISAGSVLLEVTYADGTPYNMYDFGGWKRNMLEVCIVESSAETQTRTANTGIWLKKGETRKIAFWNPTDMKDEGAQIVTFQGDPDGAIDYSYDEGSGFVTVTGTREGEVILEILEKRTETSCFIKITVGEEEPTMRVYTEPTTCTTTTPPATYVTDVATQYITTTTTVFETTTEPMMTTVDCAPQLDTRTLEMHVGEQRRIHVEHPVNGMVQSASASYHDYEKKLFDWYFDEKTSDLVITANKPCDEISVMVYADGCTLGDQMHLTILDQAKDTGSTTGLSTTTAPVHTTTVTTGKTTSAATTTTRTTTTTVHVDYAPQIDKKTVELRTGETCRVHVEHPANGKVGSAGMFCGEDGLFDWEFDKETSDLIITARKPCEGKSVSISAPGCAFNTYLTLTILASDATEPASTDIPEETETLPFGMDFAPTLTYDKSPMEMNVTRRIHVEDGFHKIVPSATLTCTVSHAVKWEYDAEHADILLTPLTSGQKLYFCVSVPGCSFNEYFSLNVKEYTAATTAPIGNETLPATTTETVTQPTETAKEGPAATYDDSYLEHGATRRVHITLDGKPVKSVQVKRIPHSCGYDMYFDSETSDLMIFASDFGEVNLLVAPEGTGQCAHVSFRIVATPTTSEVTETASTEEKIETTPVTTDPTEPAATEPAPAATDVPAPLDISSDASPMHIGEVREVRIAQKDGKAAPVQITKLSDNFVYYTEDHAAIYITALRAGKLQIQVEIADSKAVLELDVTDKQPAEQPAQTLGDLNQDTAVNAYDAGSILIEAARLGAGADHLLSEIQRAAADVNFDGIINAKDAACVLTYSAVKGTVPDTPDLALYMAAENVKPEQGSAGSKDAAQPKTKGSPDAWKHTRTF